MGKVPQQERATLTRRSLMRLEPGGQGRRFFVAFGTVWLTVEGNSAGLILRSGDAIELPARGLVVAEDLSDSAVEVFA